MDILSNGTKYHFFSTNHYFFNTNRIMVHQKCMQNDLRVIYILNISKFLPLCSNNLLNKKLEFFSFLTC